MIGGSVRPRAGTSSLDQNPHSRTPSKDEEHGKRDDDFRPRHSTANPVSWALPWKWRKRRLFAGAILIFLIYEFIKNIPNLGPIDQQVGHALRPGHVVSPPITNPRGPSAGSPPRTQDGESEFYYTGKIQYLQLSPSLRKLEKAPFGVASGNVLYAASSLKSAANLMPMACEMSRAKKSGVHMAFLGRNELPIGEIMKVNGINALDCNVLFHDGRAEYAEYSTDGRAEVSVLGAMKHINEYVNPQAIIMDDSKLEDAFFVRAMRHRATEYYKTLIEVPAGKYEEFLWMTRLDADSLENWFKPNIDIVVQAPHRGSGSLIRLLKSLTSAEYAGLKIPRLTVELPPVVEPFAQRWLTDLQWPPAEYANPLQGSQLILHHRIPSSRMGSEQTSLRFVESVYPKDPQSHHILVLTPQAELSPLFLQNLHYNILHYRHSAEWWTSGDIMGLSLDRPSILADGRTTLQNPTVASMRPSRGIELERLDQASSAPFLYQAPSSSASLIFGDKWITFHDFLQKRFVASHQGLATKQKKLMAETEPAWIEYLLELARARGWSMLHPASSMVTIHSELAQVPEEFRRPPPKASKKAPETSKQSAMEEAFLTAPEPPTFTPQRESQDASKRASLPLHQLLPFGGYLPELGSLPYLTHTGSSHLRIAVSELTEKYAPYFRQEIGGCDAKTAGRPREVEDLKADDLFCLPDVTDVRFEHREGEEEDYPAESAQPKPKAGTASGAHSPVLPGLERQPLQMLDDPAVDVGLSSHQRVEGGFGPRRPQLRGLEVVSPDGSGT